MEPDRLGLYRLMLTSRLLEEALAELWRAGLISGEMHLGIGEEGIVAGVVDHLDDGDAIAADHRSTPPLVMRGVDMAALAAECMGREAGLGRGLGGHMHLMSRDHLAAASGIVGASGPLACGFALAHQRLKRDRVAIAFFGEGAMNQGMLLESLNLAACWRLPVLFVCKDNGMAITTPSARVTAGSLPDRARALGVPAHEVDGADVEAVWRVAGEAIALARRGRGPSYVQASCVRPEGHFLGDPLLRLVRHPAAELGQRAGPLLKAVTRRTGGGLGQRASSLGTITGMVARAAGMRGRDPLRRLRGRLAASRDDLARLEDEVGATVATAVTRAREAP